MKFNWKFENAYIYIELEKKSFYNKRKGMYPSLPEKSPTYKIII